MASYNILTLSEPVTDFVATTSPATINLQCGLMEDALRKKVYAVYKAGGMPEHPYDGVRVEMEVMLGFPLSELDVGAKIAAPMKDGSKQIRVLLHKGNPDPSLYPESCNAGWTAEEAVHEMRQWHSSNVNDYANSTIHTWQNTDYAALFDPRFLAKVVEARVPYRPGSETSATINSGDNGLLCKFFLLGGYEVGLTTSTSKYFPVDGAKLSYFESGTGSSANSKRLAYYNGSAVNWALRSPSTGGKEFIWDVYSNGSSGNGTGDYCVNSKGARPACLLPLDLLLDFTPNPDGSFNPIL